MARAQRDPAKRTAAVIARRKRRKFIAAVFKTIFLTILLALFIAAGLGAYYVKNVIEDAPKLDETAVSPSQAATYIYDQNGQRVQKLTLPEANRDLVTLDRIPLDLQHAFVAIEDERFYEHNGIDVRGIFRALIKGVTTGSFSEGASTITQQLLKNSVFTDWTSERTFAQRLPRKIQEQYLALELEKIMSKDQILEDYLNTINLGAGCYGVQSAAFRYFAKDVSDLTLSESAVIAGITQNPTRYNPITNPEENAGKRAMVLEYMLRQGYISQAQCDEALADDVYSRIKYHEDTVSAESSIYTYYQDALIDQVMQDLQTEKGYTYSQAFRAVYTGGLRIFSAQDDHIQEILDKEFANPANFPAGSEVGIDYALSISSRDGQITHYGNDDLRAFIRKTSDPDFDLMEKTTARAKADAEAFKKATVKEDDTILGERVTITPQPQASAVVIDQATGYVCAVVGGRGEKDASLTLNRATYTTRQPGSTFKILTVYAPALNECGMTLATVYDNEPFFYEDGSQVSNWDLVTGSGPTTIREAIKRSVNVVAVRCITDITPRLGFEYAKAFGITTLEESYDTGNGTLTDVIQPLALGGITRGVTNLELCGAYACIANYGRYVAPKFYTQVLDHYGNVILDNLAPQGRKVIEPETAYLLTDAMRDVISSEDGTAYGLIDTGFMPSAGKSGTTSSYKDIWFAGYTPYYTCCVWGGYDNNDDLPDEGIYHTYNKILWNSIMNDIHEDLPVSAFGTPSGIVTDKVCPVTGLAAAPGCPAIEEKFREDTRPFRYCNVHGGGDPVPESILNAGNVPDNGLAPGATTIFDNNNVDVYNSNDADVYDSNTDEAQPAPDSGQDDIIIFDDSYTLLPGQDVTWNP